MHYATITTISGNAIDSVQMIKLTYCLALNSPHWWALAIYKIKSLIKFDQFEFEILAGCVSSQTTGITAFVTCILTACHNMSHHVACLSLAPSTGHLFKHKYHKTIFSFASNDTVILVPLIPKNTLFFL